MVLVKIHFKIFQIFKSKNWCAVSNELFMTLINLIFFFIINILLFHGVMSECLEMQHKEACTTEANILKKSFW